MFRQTLKSVDILIKNLLSTTPELSLELWLNIGSFLHPMQLAELALLNRAFYRFMTTQAEAEVVLGQAIQTYFQVKPKRAGRLKQLHQLFEQTLPSVENNFVNSFSKKYARNETTPEGVLFVLQHGAFARKLMILITLEDVDRLNKFLAFWMTLQPHLLLLLDSNGNTLLSRVCANPSLKNLIKGYVFDYYLKRPSDPIFYRDALDNNFYHWVAAFDELHNYLSVFNDYGKQHWIRDSDPLLADNKFNQEPLHFAAMTGALKSAKLIADMRPGIWEDDAFSASPLEIAALYDQKEMAAFFFEKYKTEILSRNIKSISESYPAMGTALILAAERGRIQFIQLLNINIDWYWYADIQARTAFIRAIINGHLEIVKLLWRDLLSNPNAMFNFDDSVETMNLPNVRIPIHDAAANGHDHIIDYLFEQKADINLIYKNNFALYEAASHDKAKAVKKLLELGAIDHKHAETKMTAFHGACAAGFTDVVRVFLVFRMNHDLLFSKDLRAALALTKSADTKKVLNNYLQAFPSSEQGTMGQGFFSSNPIVESNSFSQRSFKPM